MINPNVIEHKRILRIINENIFGESKLIYAQTITEYIRAYFRDTNCNILTSSLKVLEKSDRIILSYRYFVIDGTGNKEVDENGYNAMKAIIESEIEGYNHWNDTSYTLNAFQKIRAKEKRFRGEGDHAFLKHMEEKCKVLVYKKNVIRILDKESIQMPEKCLNRYIQIFF